MYFGKPIPEWITEHRNDTITLGEIVDYCEASARVSEQLRKRIADTDFAHDYDLSAYSFFTREEREVNRAIDVAVGILGERYGYPDDAPQDDENLAKRKAVAIDELDKGAWGVEWDKTLAKAMIESLPSAQPEPQWIPVSERLPETEEFVLASLTGKYRNTTFEHAREIADYADGGWLVYAYPHMSAEKCEELIEAWMPLPEPYKTESEDKE